MPKYIDADVMKAAFIYGGKDVCDDTDEFDTKWGASQERIEEIIDSAPAADVKPVIRCRDCKNSFMCDPGGIRCTKILNNGKYMPVEGDFFCAFGKRKEADDAEVH